jgi:putative membrane protein insertion efficiency factor
MTAKLLIALIRGYQLTLSAFVGGACRFEPSCSTYAREAIERHGAGRGSLLALRRLAKCHPFGSSGFDPVPDSPRPPLAGTSPLRASAPEPRL